MSRKRGWVGRLRIGARWLARSLALLSIGTRVTVLSVRTPLNAFSRLVRTKRARTCSFYGMRLLVCCDVRAPNWTTTIHWRDVERVLRFSVTICARLLAPFLSFGLVPRDHRWYPIVDTDDDHVFPYLFDSFSLSHSGFTSTITLKHSDTYYRKRRIIEHFER